MGAKGAILGGAAVVGLIVVVGVPLVAAALPAPPATQSSSVVAAGANIPAAGADTAGSAAITNVHQAPTQMDLAGDQLRSAALAKAGSTCPTNVTGVANPAPGAAYDDKAIEGTSSDDMAEFAAAFNKIRVSHCLAPIPVANFVWGKCMEQRLLWMAEDPSTDPASAWGHVGSVRSDGVPSVGCDGDLAGGSDNTPATVAQKWWDSIDHRVTLYRPSYTGPTNNVCIAFADVHGGIPNDPISFTRASAIWVDCAAAGVVTGKTSAAATPDH